MPIALAFYIYGSVMYASFLASIGQLNKTPKK
jgi:hypothetical protein